MNFRRKIVEYLMSKQINDTLVIGTIIVPKQECFCFGEKSKRRSDFYVKKKINAGVSFSASSP